MAPEQAPAGADHQQDPDRRDKDPAPEPAGRRRRNDFGHGRALYTKLRRDGTREASQPSENRRAAGVRDVLTKDGGK
ncbi:hypothetical protein GCM10011611_64070 [Aliidongia dinghuensis]|uniref:Uncharacterized protein n=1 Tax=Aliidongia dinghuensis TaxID=1867774 RepID=A0A8J3E6X8_9PROT|nr:hypothetical protein GCM10011611_64070 [Aliidongia dinghuensis]